MYFSFNSFDININKGMVHYATVNVLIIKLHSSGDIYCSIVLEEIIKFQCSNMKIMENKLVGIA